MKNDHNYVLRIRTDNGGEFLGDLKEFSGCKHTLVVLSWVQKKATERSSTSIDCYWAKPRLAMVYGKPAVEQNTMEFRPHTKKNDDKTYDMENMICRMVALDGMSFQLFVRSDDMRYLFLKSGHKLPKSAGTIKNIVMKKGSSLKDHIKATLSEMKQKNEKFALTFDEWTSSRSHRIFGSMPADTCIEMINDLLMTYGISFNDIAAITTDGASVMNLSDYYTNKNENVTAPSLDSQQIAEVIYQLQRLGRSDSPQISQCNSRDDWDEANVPSTSSTTAITLTPKTMAEELQETIEKSMSRTKESSRMSVIDSEFGDDLMSVIKVEMALYENGGVKGKYLLQVYDSLLKVPPTSLESERVFSSAGYLCNHLKTKLNDDTSSRGGYVENAVGYVEIKKGDTECFVRAKVVPEHKITKKYYLVTNHLDEKIVDTPIETEGCRIRKIFLTRP
ncbi:hypothetical protein MSG28_013606 [Choristoneura fumiferana]|uniref:Uncharacterized protein n=1 Tax=Choristoneura fumiferana TaxID=7141 RepID=A0ACC0K901_CHOFU|nr:hypothetical protein MSG28_013606 [Choristoneura fumiferana]